MWRFRGFDWCVLSCLSLPSVFLVSFVFGHGDNGGLHQDAIAMTTIRMQPDLQFLSPQNPPHTVVLRDATNF